MERIFRVLTHVLGLKLNLSLSIVYMQHAAAEKKGETLILNVSPEFSAANRSRTCTWFPIQRPEHCASANSAIAATTLLFITEW